MYWLLLLTCIIRSYTGFLLGFLGRGGKCRVGAEEGGHASRACASPREGSQIPRGGANASYVHRK